MLTVNTTTTTKYKHKKKEDTHTENGYVSSLISSLISW